MQSQVSTPKRQKPKIIIAGIILASILLIIGLVVGVTYIYKAYQYKAFVSSLPHSQNAKTVSPQDYASLTNQAQNQLSRTQTNSLWEAVKDNPAIKKSVIFEPYAVYSFDPVQSAYYVSNLRVPEGSKPLVAMRVGLDMRQATNISTPEGASDSQYPSDFLYQYRNRGSAMSCSSCGCACYTKLDLPVVDNHFYAVVYTAPGHDAALKEESKGVYYFSPASKQWVHLTPGIDIKTESTTEYNATAKLDPQVKITDNGCTLTYIIKNQPYQLANCKPDNTSKDTNMQQSWQAKTE